MLGVVEAVATLLLVWSLGRVSPVLGLNPYFAKGPADVWAWLVTSPEAAAHRAEIFDALASTALVAIRATSRAGSRRHLSALFHLAPSFVARPRRVLSRCGACHRAIAPLLVQALGRGPFGTTVVVAIMSSSRLVACVYGLQLAPGQVSTCSARTPHAMANMLLANVRHGSGVLRRGPIAAPSAILAAQLRMARHRTGIGNLMR